jgi:hypothetical protein
MLRLHLQVINALQRTLSKLDAAAGKALAPIRHSSCVKDTACTV